MKRLALKPMAIMISIAAVVLVFQNCDTTSGFDADIVDIVQTNLSGNGEPFTGKLAPGEYYSQNMDLECTNGSTPSNNLAATLKVVEDSDQAERTDNCTGESENIDINTIKVAKYNPELVTQGGAIFKRNEQVPDGNAPYPVVLCNGGPSFDILGFNIVIAFDPRYDIFLRALSYATGSVNNPQFTHIEGAPIQIQEAPFPMGGLAARFMREGFDLSVSHELVNPLGYHQSIYRGLIDSQAYQTPALCIYPNLPKP